MKALRLILQPFLETFGLRLIVVIDITDIRREGGGRDQAQRFLPFLKRIEWIQQQLLE